MFWVITLLGFSLKSPCLYLLCATLDILNLLLSETNTPKACSETFLVSIVNRVALIWYTQRQVVCGGNRPQVFRKRRKKNDWRLAGMQHIDMINMIVFAVHIAFCTNNARGERHCCFNFELVILLIACWHWEKGMK